MKKILDLPYEKTKGLVKVLKATLYEGHKVIIRQIGQFYFEYILEYGGEIYSSYIIIKPEKGKKKLTQDQVRECMELIYAGAEATLDALTGKDLKEEDKRIAKIFEDSRERVENALSKEAINATGV